MEHIIAPGQLMAWLPDDTPCKSKADADKVKLDVQRVLWMGRGMVVAFRIAKGKTKYSIKKNLLFYEEEVLVQAYERQQWVIETNDPLLSKLLAMTDDYKTEHQELHDTAWQAIKDIVVKEPAIFNRSDRGKYIEQAHKKHKCSLPAIRKWLVKYWRSGKSHEALYPDFHECGSPGKPHKSKTSKDDRTKLESGYKKFAALGPEDAYQETLETYFAAGSRPIGGGPLIKTDGPKKGTFMYHGTKATVQDLKSHLCKVIGSKEFHNSLKPRLGSMRYGVSGPGDRYQIDGTIDDMYLVSQFDRRLPIGRPYYYNVMDVFSHARVGFNLNLENPQWLDGASLAILCAILPKFEYYQQLGVDEALYDYLGIYLTPEMLPYQGIMTELVGDNAFNSYIAGAPLGDLCVTLTTTPPLRPYTKGLVEQGIDQWQEAYKKWVPGAVDKRRRDIKRRHNALDAKLNIREFAQLLAIHDLMRNSLKLIKGYNLDIDMRQDDVARFPYDLWNYGIENRVGPLPQKPREILEWLLLSRGEATIRHDGLLFEDQFYRPFEGNMDNLFVRAALHGRQKVEVCFHPQRMQKIAIHVPKHRMVLPFVYNTEKQDDGYADMTLFDLQVSAAIDQQEVNDYDHFKRQTQADWKHVIRKVVGKATEELKFQKQVRPPLTQKNRLKIKNNMTQEIDSGGATILGREVIDEQPVALATDSAGSDEINTTSSSQQTFSEILRQKANHHDD